MKLSKIITGAGLVATTAGALGAATSCNLFKKEVVKWTVNVSGTQLEIEKFQPSKEYSEEDATKLYIDQANANPLVFANDITYNLIKRHFWLNNWPMQGHTYAGMVNFYYFTLVWDANNNCFRASFKYHWNVTRSRLDGFYVITNTNEETVEVINVPYKPVGVIPAFVKKMIEDQGGTVPNPQFQLCYDGTDRTIDNIISYYKKYNNWSVIWSQRNNIGQKEEESKGGVFNNTNLTTDNISKFEDYTEFETPYLYKVDAVDPR